MLTRRRLVWRVAMGAVASVLWPAAGFAIQQAPEDTRYFHWTTIGPGARVAFGAGGTSLVVASGGQSLLVDTKGYGLGATLRRDVRSGANTSGWLRCLRTMIEMTQPTTPIVPSDGALALRDALQRQLDYFETLRRVVRRAIDSGMPREEAMGFIPTTNMGRFPGLERRDLLPVNLAAVYDEMF